MKEYKKSIQEWQKKTKENRELKSVDVGEEENLT